MRSFWIENAEGRIWDLTNQNLDNGQGSFLANPDGLGIRTRIRSFEVENTFFIEEINTQVQSITGTLHFKDYPHFKRFVDFIGNVNTDTPLKFYYSTGEQLEKHWYKLILIGELKKGEISAKTATLQVRVKFDCISRWKQDVEISIEIARSGNALVYPYIYP